MSADQVQALPVTNANSKDVLEDLLAARRWDGLPLISPQMAADLKARVELGVRKYGTRLQTYNDRSVRVDILQELLDGVMYSHQGVMQEERVAHIRNTLVALIEGLYALERAKT